MAVILPYTNSAESAYVVHTQKAGIQTNYTVVKQQPSAVVLGNQTAGLTADLILKTLNRATDGITKPKELTVEFPPTKVAGKAGIASHESWTVVTREATPYEPRTDFPCCMSLQVRGWKVADMTNAIYQELFEHMVSTLPRDDDGNIDFRGMLVGAMIPTSDNAEP